MRPRLPVLRFLGICSVGASLALLWSSEPCRISSPVITGAPQLVSSQRSKTWQIGSNRVSNTEEEPTIILVSTMYIEHNWRQQCMARGLGSKKWGRLCVARGQKMLRCL
ncbi:hypothetical protein QBC38DRAFT_100894 [Podospora fimiseda]|uniref:Secreted protein n=1 Tax=Podospora fimiseda TaxID=252190 RepID=A0AAN6YNQ7_9PEZI|nr:hypothetical protein QBC38DRAFT_100894 [Podospora fimiseda]